MVWLRKFTIVPLSVEVPAGPSSGESVAAEEGPSNLFALSFFFFFGKERLGNGCWE